MTVIESEQQTDEPHITARNWFESSGLYTNLSVVDREDIQSFLLQPEVALGVPTAYFADPFIEAVAQVADGVHEGQFRKATPTHPYMKHVHMVALQCGRLQQGGDLEPSLPAYLKAHNQQGLLLEPFTHLVIGGAYAHDGMETNKETLSKEGLYQRLRAQGVPYLYAERIATISQFMIPPDKKGHLPPTEYMSIKEMDFLHYYEPEAVERLGLVTALAVRLIKASDVYAVALEMRDDLAKQREGSHLCDPELFNASLGVRLATAANRTNLLKRHDPANPFIPLLEAIVEGELFDHAAGVNGVENRGF